jgi:hypothetical protein
MTTARIPSPPWRLIVGKVEMRPLCNGVDSKELVRAVREQSDVIEELGGFDSDDDCSQFLRDARDVARKLYIAEQVIAANSLSAVYEVALKTNTIGDSPHGR